MGAVAQVCTNATMRASAVIAVIIQAAATVWMSPPKFEAMLEIQKRRKIGIFKGESDRSPRPLNPVGRHFTPVTGCPAGTGLTLESLFAVIVRSAPLPTNGQFGGLRRNGRCLLIEIEEAISVPGPHSRRTDNTSRAMISLRSLAA